MAPLKTGVYIAGMTDTVRPFLMFQGGEGSAALDFYLSLFPDARVDD